MKSGKGEEVPWADQACHFLSARRLSFVSVGSASESLKVVMLAGSTRGVEVDLSVASPVVLLVRLLAVLRLEETEVRFLLVFGLGILTFTALAAFRVDRLMASIQIA